jgi:predicted adenine nucleotide alpha hydrolase (AANH) superfamily ATPase
MKLLFHCCCGPCASACLETLRCETSPELLWYNPNIHPFTEYSSRRDSLVRLGMAENLKVMLINEYGLRAFIRGIGDSLENGPEFSRCLYCYRVRLEKTATTACDRGFDAFSTSLLASPYQRHDSIRAIGEELAQQYRIEFLYRDFRPRFRDGQARSRSMGLYMQKYCGCIFSEEERYGISKNSC